MFSFYLYIQRNPVIFPLSNKNIQCLYNEKPNLDKNNAEDKTKRFVEIAKLRKKLNFKVGG